MLGVDPTVPSDSATSAPTEDADFLDLYPQSLDEHKALITWCQNAFTAADEAREPQAQRWRRYYKLYRSYVQKGQSDWRSRVFIPVVFWIIETITPRLVAQLPKFVVNPVGPEDVEPAKVMETLLDWSTRESALYAELVKAYKSALKYGTGVLKTYHRVEKRRARRMVPVMEPQMAQIPVPAIDPETGQPMNDQNGDPMIEIREEIIGEIPVGMRPERYSYTAYDGPAAECVDIFNFWVNPEADEIETARYVIHRTFKEWSYVQKQVERGIYRLPDGLGPEGITDLRDEPSLERLDSVGLGAGQGNDPTRKPVEILEFWTDDGRVITMANRKAILRVHENPFDHGEKPFVRIVDYLAEHEFWGIGEIEPLEGLQDLQNALLNSRVDNIKLVLNSMFAVNTENVEDLRDLQFRPGGIIRLRGDLRPQEVIERIDLGDVTASAFVEAESNERLIEKVSGVSNVQMGLDSPASPDTATGAAIITEQGASRFGLKSRLAEILGMRRLGRHYGSILQQFTVEERVMRMAGPMGQFAWQTFDPASLQGALDYDIESESTTQTDTMRREQAMSLLQVMSAFAPQAVPALVDDLLDAFGKKDKQRYLMGVPTLGQPPGMGPAAPPAPPSGLPPGLAAGQQPPMPGQQNAEQMLAEIEGTFNQGAS